MNSLTAIFACFLIIALFLNWLLHRLRMCVQRCCDDIDELKREVADIRAEMHAADMVNAWIHEMVIDIQKDVDHLVAAELGDFAGVRSFVGLKGSKIPGSLETVFVAFQAPHHRAFIASAEWDTKGGDA